MRMKRLMRKLQPLASLSTKKAPPAIEACTSTNHYIEPIEQQPQHRRKSVEAWLGKVFRSSDSERRRAHSDDRPRRRKRDMFRVRRRSAPPDMDTQGTIWLQPVATVKVEEPQDDDEENNTSTTSKSFPLLEQYENLPSSDRMDKCDEVQEYVSPPVSVPAAYRMQDRNGGVVVSGQQVLFTNAAFKRKLRLLSYNQPIPEHAAVEPQDNVLDENSWEGPQPEWV